MSINPLSNVSSIWSRATTALTNTPDPSSKPAAGPSPSGPPNSAGQGSGVSPSTPFQKLASDLQAVLLQMQSGHGGQGASQTASATPDDDTTRQLASLGQSATGSAQQARPHHHQHRAPAADQPAGNALSAVA
jgi:hypothetical protein